MEPSPARDSPCYLWTGVLNNPSEEDIETLSNLEAKELVIDREVAPSTGTPHLHIYLNLHQKRRLSGMKKIHPEVHWEHVRSRQATIDYCSKGEVLVTRLQKIPKKKVLSQAIELL